MKMSRETANVNPDIAEVMDSSNSIETSLSSTAVDGAFPDEAADITTASERIIPILGRTSRREDCKIGRRSFEFGFGFVAADCLEACWLLYIS